MAILGLAIGTWGFIFYWLTRREILTSRALVLEQTRNLTVRVAQLEEELRKAGRIS